MSDAYSIRSYEEGDDERIVDLLHATFSGWPHRDLSCSPLEHWRWKYLDNPIGPRMIVVAEKDSEIVGAFHATLSRIHIGNETILGSNESDVATHPDHRRRGIYTRIQDFQDRSVIEKGIPVFYYGIESNPILIKKNIAEGTDVLTPQKVVIYMRVNDIFEYRSMWFKKLGYRILRNFNTLLNRENKKKTDFKIEQTTKFDDRVNYLLEQNKMSFGYILERDKEYLNWRYTDSRGGDYHIWYAVEDERKLGFIVVRINRYEKSNPLGYVMDLLVEPGRLDVADSLMDAGLTYFSDNGVNMVYFLGVQGGFLEQVLRHHGFVNSRERLLWNYSDDYITSELSSIITKLPSKKVYFSFGDFDWI